MEPRFMRMRPKAKRLAMGIWSRLRAALKGEVEELHAL